MTANTHLHKSATCLTTTYQKCHSPRHLQSAVSPSPPSRQVLPSAILLRHLRLHLARRRRTQAIPGHRSKYVQSGEPLLRAQRLLCRYPDVCPAVVGLSRLSHLSTPPKADRPLRLKRCQVSRGLLPKVHPPTYPPSPNYRRKYGQVGQGANSAGGRPKS